MRARALVLGVLALVAAGCAPPAGRPTPSAPGPSVWPPPPARARIRFVMTVARPRDLGVEPSFWRRLGEIVVGRQEEWFVRPTAVVADARFLYVADPGAQSLWVLDTRAGRFRRIQRARGERLISPVAVALGRNERVWVADSFLAKVYAYDSEGNLMRTIADPGLRRPAGLAYDRDRDRLYVADSLSHRVWILTEEGRMLGAIGDRGTGDGQFNFPSYVTVDRAGMLYVTDSLGFRVQMFRPDGGFAGAFGQHGDSSGDFAMPKGVAVDSEGHVYIVDALFDAVQIFDRTGQYLLTFGERGIAPGQFWLPGGVFIDGRDRIYVADAYNQRVQIFDYLAGGGDE